MEIRLKLFLPRLQNLQLDIEIDIIAIDRSKKKRIIVIASLNKSIQLILVLN
jgi:hypothetical protein